MRPAQPPATQAARQNTDLAAVLDAERRALLAGDLHRLAEIAQVKEQQLASCAANPARLRNAPRLLAELRRNQRLLDSALQGIAAARARIAAQQALLLRMDTYDPSGRKTPIGHGRFGKIQKKL